MAVTPDGQRVVSASGDKTLELWDLASGRALRTFTGHSGSVNAVAVTSDGQRVLSASEDQTLKVWELASGRELATFKADAALYCCAVSPDGKTILAGDTDGVIHVLRPRVEGGGAQFSQRRQLRRSRIIVAMRIAASHLLVLLLASLALAQTPAAPVPQAAPPAACGRANAPFPPTGRRRNSLLSRIPVSRRHSRS